MKLKYKKTFQSFNMCKMKGNISTRTNFINKSEIACLPIRTILGKHASHYQNKVMTLHITVVIVTLYQISGDEPHATRWLLEWQSIETTLLPQICPKIKYSTQMYREWNSIVSSASDVAVDMNKKSSLRNLRKSSIIIYMYIHV